MPKRSESYSERFLVAKISEEMDISVLVDKIWGLVDKNGHFGGQSGWFSRHFLLFSGQNLQVSGHFPCGPILIPILVHIPFL